MPAFEAPLKLPLREPDDAERSIVDGLFPAVPAPPCDGVRPVLVGRAVVPAPAPPPP